MKTPINNPSPTDRMAYMRNAILTMIAMLLISGCSLSTSQPVDFPNHQSATSDNQTPNISAENEDLTSIPTPQTIKIQGSIGHPHIQLEGFPTTVQTGPDGCYQAEVPAPWSGTVRPVSDPLRFDPPERTYNDINTPAYHEDYQGHPRWITITGSTQQPGISIQGLPNSILTDAKGHYQAKVPSGWSGRIIPSQIDGEFLPAYRSYENLTSDLASQDFHPLVHPATEESPIVAATSLQPTLVSPPSHTTNLLRTVICMNDPDCQINLNPHP